MGFFGKIWKGLKGAGKWAVKHPETVSAGISVFDARRRSLSQKRSSQETDYTLPNLNERIRQLQDTLAEEISAVRSDINTVSSELQQDYTSRLSELSQQVENIRVAQNYQARALKRLAILYGGVLCALIVGVVVLFLSL